MSRATTIRYSLTVRARCRSGCRMSVTTIISPAFANGPWNARTTNDVAYCPGIARSKSPPPTRGGRNCERGARAISGGGRLSACSIPPPALLRAQARFAGRPPRVGGGDFDRRFPQPARKRNGWGASMTYSHTAATDPISSAWVSANAGAGKTYLLTDRVTRLLLAGSQPSRILCLTYTKAAASEMASRLFDRLGQWALLPDEELDKQLLAIGAGFVDADMRARARRLFAQALETPGGLKIQTIHSFCQNVLARFPVEAGIPARFTVLDERSATELMTEARNAALQRAAKGDEHLAKAVAVLATRAADGQHGNR